MSQKKGLSGEFLEFLQKFGVIGLAIAFIIDQAASKLVTAFVNDIITPFMGLLTPQSDDLKTMSFTIYGATFSYGNLLANVIYFLIIAFIVFLAYKQLSKFKIIDDKKETS